jgi:hypothetical protein
MILEKNGERGLYAWFFNKSSRVSAKTHHKIVETAKAHASEGMREQAAVLSCDYFLLEFAVREDFKKAGAQRVQR